MLIGRIVKTTIFFCVLTDIILVTLSFDSMIVLKYVVAYGFQCPAVSVTN